MTPSEHYAEAEKLIGQYKEADAAVREVAAEMMREGLRSEAVEFSTSMLPGAALLLQEAQVHATLATAKPVDVGAPIIVSLPSDALERVKIVDAGDFNRGILFIPDEGTVTVDDRPLSEILLEAMQEEIDPNG